MRIVTHADGAGEEYINALSKLYSNPNRNDNTPSYSNTRQGIHTQVFNQQPIKLPPYGRQINQYPITQEIRVYFGDSPQVWTHARARQKYGPAVLLPSGEDYKIFRWEVKKRQVLMLQIGDYVTEEIPGFARTLLIAGAEIVRVLHPDGLATFRPQRREAA